MRASVLPDRFRARVRRSPLPPVVILGVNPMGLAIARALARHGVPALGIHGTRPRPEGYSSAWDIAHPGRPWQLAELASYLPRVAELAGQRPLLIPTHDLLVEFMAQRRELLSSCFLFELPDDAILQRFRSKRGFAEAAARHGWRVPVTRFVTKQDELAECARSQTFPLIIKPNLGTAAFRMSSTRKAAICATPAELRQAYAEFSAWESDMVVQEWVPGGDEEVSFSLHYFTRELREVGRFAGRKLRQWPPRCGSTTVAIPFPDAELSESAAQLLSSSGCSGFCSVEYKRDPRSGLRYIIEATVGRPDLQIGLAVGNGVDLISRAYSHLTGSVLSEPPPPARPCRWIWLAPDLQAARAYQREGQLTLSGYLRSLRGPRIFAVWDPRDLSMYPSLLLGFFGFWLAWLAGRVRRLRMRAQKPE
jgi:D-aspartate ligase